MSLAEYVFWASFLLVAHTYLLYPSCSSSPTRSCRYAGTGIICDPA
jgi:hypothetical protein